MSLSQQIKIFDNKVVLCPLLQHTHTLIFLHGLRQTHLTHLQTFLTQPLKSALLHVKVVFPQSPTIDLSIAKWKKRSNSWLDLKVRGPGNMYLPFDDAYSRSDLEHSYTQIVNPIIQEEEDILGRGKKKLIMGGFSMGSSMAWYTYYRSKIQFAGIICCSGYMFNITPIMKNKGKKKLIYGLADRVSQWSKIMKSYQKIIDELEVVLVEGMDHTTEHKGANYEIAKFVLEVTQPVVVKL